MTKKKIIIIISILLVLAAVTVATIKIVKYEQLKKGIYGAVETADLGYSQFTPALPGDCEETDDYKNQLHEQVDYQFDMKNLKIIKKLTADSEDIENRAVTFKMNYGVDFDISSEVFYIIEVDVRVKYDYDENNSIITEEYKAWNEKHKENNHKWSEWETEKHNIEAVKIDGKWYYECWDGEENEESYSVEE